MKTVETKVELEKKVLKFPDNFLWGSATSSHQVEGENVWNDWCEFEKAGNVKNKEVSGITCDHYNRYKKDFEIAKSLHQNAHRLSIEWSRIEKEKGIYDREEIEHYKKVLKNLKDNNFQTFVTIHHFTNPLWMANEGGWTANNSVKYFAEFVKKIVPELNEYVDFWITINEPTVFTANGYLTKIWPPAKFSPIKFYWSLKNLVAGHKVAYKIIKEVDPKAQIGIVHNFAPFVPAFWIFNKIVFWGRNHYFVDQIKNECDFIGVNYYFPAIYYLTNKKMRKTDLKWPIYPYGMYKILQDLQNRYALPMYITENGIADAKDKYRKEFIEDHLKYIHKAIGEGCDVRGYFYWSLLDNFEWAEGFDARFGLVEVDYKTQKRTIRKSALFYSEIAKNNYIKIDN